MSWVITWPHTTAFRGAEVKRKDLCWTGSVMGTFIDVITELFMEDSENPE